MRSWVSLVLIVAVSVLFVAACGEVEKTATSKLAEATEGAKEAASSAMEKAEGAAGSIAEQAEGLTEMSGEALQAKVGELQNVLVEKKTELEQLKNELAKLPVSEMAGEKATQLKNKVSTLSSQIADLQEKIEPYIGSEGS